MMASNRIKPANKQAQRQRQIGAPPLAHIHRIADGKKWLQTRAKKTLQAMPNRPIKHDKRSTNTTASQNEVRIVAHSGD
jgi:hypothetical protein